MSALSISVSGGAAHGVVVAGALTALRDRGIVPETVSGISSGIMAAALAYGSADRERQLEFFAFAFREVRQRFAPTRVASTLLPPYDVSGGATLDQLAPFVDAPATYREAGLKSLWAGVATWPAMGFEAHELLAADDPHHLLVQVARSSMMPFMTHDTLHLQGGLDGAFRHNHFVPPDAPARRWLMTYARKPFTSGRGPRGAYDRVILLRSPFLFALHLDPGRIARAWDSGYAQGRAL